MPGISDPLTAEQEKQSFNSRTSPKWWTSMSQKGLDWTVWPQSPNRQFAQNKICIIAAWKNYLTCKICNSGMLNSGLKVHFMASHFHLYMILLIHSTVYSIVIKKNAILDRSARWNFTLFLVHLVLVLTFLKLNEFYAYLQHWCTLYLCILMYVYLFLHFRRVVWDNQELCFWGLLLRQPGTLFLRSSTF